MFMFTLMLTYQYLYIHRSIHPSIHPTIQSVFYAFNLAAVMLFINSKRKLSFVSNFLSSLNVIPWFTHSRTCRIINEWVHQEAYHTMSCHAISYHHVICLDWLYRLFISSSRYVHFRSVPFCSIIVFHYRRDWMTSFPSFPLHSAS